MVKNPSLFLHQCTFAVQGYTANCSGEPRIKMLGIGCVPIFVNLVTNTGLFDFTLIFQVNKPS